MTTQTCTALLSFLLTGCLATTSSLPSTLPAAGLKSEVGTLTVVQRSAAKRQNFEAPFRASVDKGKLTVECYRSDCGGRNQPCCANDSCDAPSTACDNNGLCTDCGGQFEPPCTTSAPVLITAFDVTDVLRLEFTRFDGSGPAGLLISLIILVGVTGALAAVQLGLLK